ncbi:TAXI family TRAP transporter solute-binding subunit [Crocosphaera sp.]|uniref:TAXI family TRAP transporter solute-binding subunit n=1 Tax=Crocosphaera sp. TaxID=2729996 RepID=UPI003F271FC3|nr:TAXI family TRAP transporter solute-binding subunit [Crocosphaera sp.]
MQESILRKAAIPVIFSSIILVIVFAILWFRDSHKISTLTLVTGSKQGQYYAFGKALSKVVNNHNSRIKIQVKDSDGSLENAQLLHTKKADLALIQSDTLVTPSTKAISILFPELFHLIVHEDANIERVSDLEGKKIALMPEKSGSYTLFWSLRDHYQLDINQLQTIPMYPLDAHQALKNGEVDALFQVISLENPTIVQLLQNPQLKLIGIEQGSALKLELPALEVISIPKGAYHGGIPIPPDDLPAVAVRAVLVTHKDISRDIIFEITRILYEARNELVQEFTQAAMIDEQYNHDNHRNFGFAFHPGALDYYNQEKPSFIVEYAEAIGLFLSVSMLIISGIWQLRLWLTGKQKNRADLYNLQLLKIIDTIQTIKTLEQLYEVKLQLLEMLDKVIIDLDKDLISPESFQSFTFPWQVALSSIHQRENLLMGLQGERNESI